MANLELQFVSFEPHFGTHEPPDDNLGMRKIYDAEGDLICLAHPEHAAIISYLLDRAMTCIEEDFGVGWGNLTNAQALKVLQGRKEEVVSEMESTYTGGA